MSQPACTYVDNDALLDAATSELEQSQVFGLDTETTGLDPFRSRIRLVQIATPERSFVIDLFKVKALARPQLRALLESPSHTKVLHNAKFDVKMILHHGGIELSGIFDTLLVSKLIAAGRGDLSHGLSAVCERFLGEAVDKSEQLSDWSGPLSAEQIEYAAKDAAVLIDLERKMSVALEELRMSAVASLEFDCVLPLAAMELAGMPLDRDCWLAQSRDAERAHDILSADLKRELAPWVEQPTLFGDPDINLESPQQIIEILGRMGLKLEGTRSWQLQPYAKDHPIIPKLLEYRAVQKAMSSYGEGMLDHLNPVTGCLHADFRQIGATGGRMSCSDPNLQQIPNSPEYRGCFRAPQGRKMVVADYSQIELRILADWSQDIELTRALSSGEDLHCATASQMLGVHIDQVSREQRAAAKQLNYGLVYGLGPQGLAARIECSVPEAEQLIKKYFSVYRGVADWLAEAASRALEERENRTRSGRLICFTFDPDDRGQVAAIERLGKNAPIQGTSADIIKRALALLYEALKGMPAQIVHCVHDEIVVEVDESEGERCCDLVRKIMTDAAHEFIRSIPVTVDAKISDAWLK